MDNFTQFCCTDAMIVVSYDGTVRVIVDDAVVVAKGNLLDETKCFETQSKDDTRPSY